MTSTREILNDTTSVQSRIDTVLSAEENQLDWANDSGWFPGDPLHDPPRGYMLGEQHIRPLLEVIDSDGEHFLDGWHWQPRCEPCAVSWAGDEACWVCNDPKTAIDRSGIVPGAWARVFDEVRWSRTPDRVARAFTAFTAFATDDIARQLTAAAAPAIEALERITEAMEAYRPRVVLGFDGSRSDQEPLAMRFVDQVWLLPAVEDPAAPTLEEINQGRSLVGFLSAPETPAFQVPADLDLTHGTEAPAPPDVDLTLATHRPDLYRRPPDRYSFDRHSPNRRWSRWSTRSS